MKSNKIYFLLQLMFFLVVPCALIWLQYSDGAGVKYKIPMTAILLFIFVFLFAKRVWLNPWLKKVSDKLGQIETLQLATTDQTAVQSLKKQFRSLSLIQLFFNAVVPILLLGLVIVTIKAVETGIVKLFGALMLCAVSFAVGLVFKVLEIYSVKMEHEQKKEKTK